MSTAVTQTKKGGPKAAKGGLVNQSDSLLPDEINVGQSVLNLQDS